MPFSHGTLMLTPSGFGILDVGYKNGDVAYACGGSGSLYKTEDGGNSWKRDKGRCEGVLGGTLTNGACIHIR